MKAGLRARLSYTETGAPVKDATVALQGIHPTTGWGRTRVDTKGSYLLTNLAPGFYNLYLYKGPKGWTAVAKELIEVVKGQTVSNIDLTLVRGGFITGRVIDQDTSETDCQPPYRISRRSPSGISGSGPRYRNGRNRCLSLPSGAWQSAGLR